jgi:hypothetical protein
MQIERYVQRLRPLENRRKQVLIQIPAVGMTIDKCTFESELGDRTLQLLGCIDGRLDRQHRKTGEAGGIFLNDCGQPIINLPGQADCRIAFQGLNTRLHMREHLQVDARRVHAADPFRTNISETSFDHVEHFDP